MSGNGQNASILEEGAAREFSRRRRTPSKYAQSIRQLAKMSHKQSKKEKISSSNEEESSLYPQQAGNNGNTLTCILPGTNKKLRLSVIIKKSQKPKLVKKITKPSIQKQKPKEQPKGKSLLDTLLEACEQIKEDDNNKEDREIKSGDLVNNTESQRRQMQARKERQEQQKYLKLYEKYQNLKVKLEQSQTEIVMI